MIGIDSAFRQDGVSKEKRAIPQFIPDAHHHPTEYLIPGAAQPSEGETMSPSQQCADTGRCNAAPSSSNYNIDDYERSNAPVIWPKCLDEESGSVNEDWAFEMRRLKIKFYRSLGSRLFWRTTFFN